MPTERSPGRRRAVRRSNPAALAAAGLRQGRAARRMSASRRSEAARCAPVARPSVGYWFSWAAGPRSVRAGSFGRSAARPLVGSPTRAATASAAGTDDRRRLEQTRATPHTVLRPPGGLQPPRRPYSVAEERCRADEPPLHGERQALARQGHGLRERRATPDRRPAATARRFEVEHANNVGGVWTPVVPTTIVPAPDNLVCGEVDSFSPFAVGYTEPTYAFSGFFA